MFAFSLHGDWYNGSFDTVEEAVVEATDGYGYNQFWVGECVPPSAPENYFYASDWLDHVSCQDEYMGDWADDWCGATKEQQDELETAVRKVMTEWLDRHQLRPRHFTIKDAVRYVVVDGKAQKADNAVA